MCMHLTQGERRGFYLGLRQELSQIAPEETLVVGEDCNCTMDFTKDRNGEEPQSVSVGVLRDIINQFNLVDVWRTKHPNTRQYTFLRVQESEQWAVGTILSVGFLDHHITVAQLSISPGPRQASYWKFNVKLLLDATLCSGFQTFWETWGQRREYYESLSQW
jgi:hypothetical protein